MYNIRKPTYTQVIPKGAKLCTEKGKRVAKFKRNGETVTAEVIGDGKRCRVRSKVWYIRYKDAYGQWQRAKGFTDKGATEQRAKEIVRGLHVSEDHRKRPVSKHLDDFEKSLSAWCEKHVHQVITVVRSICERCEFARLSDIDANAGFAVEEYLAELREKGRSEQTCKHHLAAIKQFFNWLVKRRRLIANPLVGLEPGNVEADRRRMRRALSAEEVQALLVSAQASGKTIRKLSGTDRHAVYCVALGTGLRASEVASLKPESFHLDEEVPYVVVEAGTSKRRRRDEQPLPPDVAEVLRGYLIDKPIGERLWPSSWSERAADMLKADMNDARNAWIKNAPNTREEKARKESDFLRHQNRQGEVADFHATRHTYITTVATRFPSKLAQELARHSDGRLTDKYTHIKLAEAGAAVAQLPALSGVNNDDQHGDQSNDRNHPHGVAG